jgi:hypothetical protein
MLQPQRGAGRRSSQIGHDSATAAPAPGSTQVAGDLIDSQGAFMQPGFLVRRSRRVSLLAVFVAVLALVLGSAAAFAALLPLPAAL